MSAAPFRRQNKYRAKKTVVDGITFDSAAEARRYGYLKLMEGQGEITDLRLQPEYPLTINGVTVCKARWDFRYIEAGRGVVIEDVKGVRTPVYRLKKKLFEALHPGLTVTEVAA